MSGALPALLLAAGLLASWPARAAEVTEIIDAYPVASAWALRPAVGLRWRWQQRDSAIRREVTCVARETIGGRSLCPDGSGAVLARELVAQRSRAELALDTQLAIGDAVALGLTLPLILTERTSLAFDRGVDGGNSVTAPHNLPQLFTVPHDGRDRAGLGDLALRVRAAPLGASGALERAAWVVELGLTVPTAAVKRADNDEVGEGVWRVHLSNAVSARVLPWLEPFFVLDGELALPGDGSLFRDYGPTQPVAHPAHRAGVAAGFEFVPFERPATRSAVRLEIGGRVDLYSDGRGYSDLFEALGSSPCDPASADAPCTLTTFDRGDIDDATGSPRVTDGVTDIEHHAVLGAWIGVRYEVFESLRLVARGRIDHATDHFLTFADIGADLDGEGDVQPVNSAGVSELNPVYNSTYDKPGTRFRASGVTQLGLEIAVQGRF